MRIFITIKGTVFMVVLFLLLGVLPTTWAAPPSSGIQHYEHGMYLKAIRDLKKDLKQDPNNTNALYYIGLAYLELGKTQQSRTALNQVLKLDPGFSKAHMTLGLLHFDKKEYKKALDHFKKARASEDQKGEALFYIGLTLKEMGQLDEALTTLSKAENLSPEFSNWTQLNRGLIFAKKRQFNKARESFQNSLEATDDPAAANELKQLISDSEGQKPWRIGLQAGGVYDDNVTLTNVNRTKGAGDRYTFYQFSSFYDALDNENFQLEIGYNFYQTLFENLTDFDLQIHTGSVTAFTFGEDWSADLNYSYNYVNVGGLDFENLHSIAPGIQFQITENWSSRISYGLNIKDFFRLSPRDGFNHTLQFANYFSIDDNLIWLVYYPEYENTRHDEFIYVAQNLNVGTQVPLKFLDLDTSLQLGYFFYYRDYPFIDPVISAQRQDVLHQSTVKLIQPVLDGMNLSLTYQHIQSLSNLPANNFRENTYTASIVYNF